MSPWSTLFNSKWLLILGSIVFSDIPNLLLRKFSKLTNPSTYTSRKVTQIIIVAHMRWRAISILSLETHGKLIWCWTQYRLLLRNTPRNSVVADYCTRSPRRVLYLLVPQNAVRSSFRMIKNSNVSLLFNTLQTCKTEWWEKSNTQLAAWKVWSRNTSRTQRVKLIVTFVHKIGSLTTYVVASPSIGTYRLRNGFQKGTS